MVHPLPSGYDTPLVFISVSTSAQAPTFGPWWGPSYHLISSTFQYGLLQSQESPTKGLANIKISAVKQLSTKPLINQPTYNFCRLFNSMTDEASFLSSVNMSCNKTELRKQKHHFPETHANVWWGLIDSPVNINSSSWQMNYNHTIWTLFNGKLPVCS